MKPRTLVRTPFAYLTYDISLTKQDHDPEGTKQIRLPRSKIILALTSKQSQTNKYAQGEDKRFEHDAGIIERCYDGDTVSLESGEPGKEYHVCRVRLALPEGKAKEDKGADERHPHHPLVCLDPVAVCLREHGHGADTGGCEELDSPGYC